MPEAPLPDQLWTVGWSGVLGLALSMFYTLLQLIRKHCGTGMQILLDAVFGMSTAAAFFIFAVSIARSRLRLFIPVSMLIGAAIWQYGVRQLRIHFRLSAKINKTNTQKPPLYRMFWEKSRKK